jgi:hypothetical protein
MKYPVSLKPFQVQETYGNIMAEIFMMKYYNTSLSMNGIRRFRELTVESKGWQKDL